VGLRLKFSFEVRGPDRHPIHKAGLMRENIEAFLEWDGFVWSLENFSVKRLEFAFEIRIVGFFNTELILG
jgi:hypothetical protein